jgi:hypothetical protein
MAAHALLTYRDGKLEVPEDLQREWHLLNGDQLEVSLPGVRTSPLLGELQRNPKEIDWRQFEGILADPDIHLNAELDKERVRENE